MAASRTLKRDGQDDGTELTGFNAWSPVKVLEQHSEKSLVVSHPYAYIGDYVLPITLSADIAAEVTGYEQRQMAERERLDKETRDALEGLAPTSDSPVDEEFGQRRRKGPPVAMKSNGIGTNGASLSANGGGSGASTPSRRSSIARLRRQERQLDWIIQLRDKLQPSAEMGWYVVVVDDEERKLDEDYEPYEPEYIEIFPSKQQNSERSPSQAGMPQLGAGSQLGADDARSRTGGVESALSTRSRTDSELVNTSGKPRQTLGKRRGSVARLRGLFRLKEKQKVEKETKWEGAAEWEKMQRKQREQADNSAVKQPFPPGWEKSERSGNLSPMSANFSRPVTGNSNMERPGTAMRLSMVGE